MSKIIGLTMLLCFQLKTKQNYFSGLMFKFCDLSFRSKKN